MADTQKLLLRTLVDNVYDVQATRIAMGNRLIASLRDLGIIVAKDPENLKLEPQRKGGKKAANSDVEEEDDAKAKEDRENNKLLVTILDEYNKVSMVYAEKFGSKGSIEKALQLVEADSIYIKSAFTYDMVKCFVQMVNMEKKVGDVLAKEVKKHPMWDAFFKDVVGCGPLMSAVCIAYLDPYKARWPSSFWKYCGLDVVVDENGAHGRSRKDAFMVSYIDRDGKPAEKKSLGYNPVVKTKLVGVLGTSFLRKRKDSKYAALYYEYRNRLENRPDCQDLRPIVIHRRAIRYMVKIFLKDLWYAWRTLEGLPTGEPYEVAKLGMAPHHDPRTEATDDDVTAAALKTMNL